jgi:hypothetical protein
MSISSIVSTITAAPIAAYNFLFHPLHHSHTDDVKGCSILSNMALTAITGGWYLILFGGIHAREYVLLNLQMQNTSDAKTASTFKKVFKLDDKPIQFSHEDFIGTLALKKEQRTLLQRLLKYASRNEWEHLQKITYKKKTRFDDVAFPTADSSIENSDKYRLTPFNIEMLKNDEEWMENYREIVTLVAQSYGWDLKNSLDISDAAHHWRPYAKSSCERLGQMLKSLKEFGHPVKDLYETLRKFASLYDTFAEFPRLKTKYEKYL